MTAFERFEDMRSWQSARELVGMIYRPTDLQDFSHDFALRDQIRRAVISVMSNLKKLIQKPGETNYSTKEESGEYSIELPDNIT